MVQDRPVSQHCVRVRKYHLHSMTHRLTVHNSSFELILIVASRGIPQEWSDVRLRLSLNCGEVRTRLEALSADKLTFCA